MAATTANRRGLTEVSTPDGGEIARLIALADSLRGDLDRLHTQATVRAVTERATGMLMERLGCSAAQARHQLEQLASAAGVTTADIAAEIAGEDLVPGSAPDRRAAARADAEIAVAADAARLSEALLAEVLAAEGAQAVAIWLLAPDGGIELAGEAGFGPAEASRWRRIPPDVPTLPLRAVRRDVEIWWPSGRPAGEATHVIGAQAVARAVVPLRQQGVCVGALEVCWPSAASGFSESVRRLLPALADPAAQALSAGLPATGYSRAWVFGALGGLHDRVLFARAVRDDDGNLDDFVIDWASDGFPNATGRHLAEIYPEAVVFGAAAQVLASGSPQAISGLRSAAGGVAEVTIARLYDGVLISWRDASETERLAALLEQAQWLGQIGSWEEDLVTGHVHWPDATCALFGLPPGQPVRLGDLHQRVPAEDIPAVRAFRDRLARQPEPVTGAFRVIRAGDGSVRQLRAVAQAVTGQAGEIIAVRGAYQDVSERYHTQAAFAVTREELADAEERVREEHKLAIRLQQAITPQVSHPVEAGGIDVTARYRPASRQHLVGGDWYDAVLLPDKKVLLTVGDVAGHGIGAVTGMVALRNHLRGLAITGAAPGTLLAWLNSAAFHLAGVIATAICGIYDPQTRTLQWARAGHLPPIVVRDGVARITALPSGPLLGADPDAVYTEATLRLQLGDALLLFTDGLIERHGQTLDDALEDLARLASRPVTDTGQFADDLLAGTPSDTGDDTCLVAVRIR